MIIIAGKFEKSFIFNLPFTFIFYFLSTYFSHKMHEINILVSTFKHIGPASDPQLHTWHQDKELMPPPQILVQLQSWSDLPSHKPSGRLLVSHLAGMTLLQEHKQNIKLWNLHRSSWTIQKRDKTTQTKWPRDLQIFQVGLPIYLDSGRKTIYSMKGSKMQLSKDRSTVLYLGYFSQLGHLIHIFFQASCRSYSPTMRPSHSLRLCSPVV